MAKRVRDLTVPSGNPNSVEMLGMSIYQLMATTDRGDQLAWETAEQPLTARSIDALRKRLENLTIDTIVLRHDSAYDEMIGQPIRLRSGE